MMLAPLLISLRPHQWVKNALVLSAPLAAGTLLNADTWWRAVIAFVAFSMAASAIYLINDVMDVRADREHPRKRFRPIAAGTLSRRSAVVAAGILLISASATAAWLEPISMTLIALYVVNSLAYSLWIKHVAVVDLLSVAAGFVLRAAFGAVVVHVPVSQWFLTVLAFGSLAMAAGKRSSELRFMGDGSGLTRKVLEIYTPAFLLQVEAIAVGGALVGYALWAFDLAQGATGAIWLQLSIIPFAAALLRYLLAISRGEAEAPEKAISADRAIGLSGLIWAFLFVSGVWQ